MKLKRRASHPPLTTGPGAHHHAPVPPPPAAITARNRTADTAMTDNVRAILPPAANATEAAEGHAPSLPPEQQQQQEPSLTTALNATFRFALPDECLPSRGLEAVEWLAKGPPRVRASGASCVKVNRIWNAPAPLFWGEVSSSCRGLTAHAQPS